MDPRTVAPGTPVDVSFTKYGGAPHWRFGGVVMLGNDDHGTWIGAGPGASCSRPGRSLHVPGHWVSLVPDEDWSWLTVNSAETGLRSQLYVDIATPAQWSLVDGRVSVTAVDLDLDVIRRFTGEVFIDDEDEFADHQVELAYPADMVATARAAADRILGQMRAGQEPYGGVGAQWLARAVDLIG